MILKTPMLLATVGILTLSACTDTGPRAQNGAVIGGILGGFIAATRPGEDKAVDTAVGATVGALIGGAIGNSLDKQAGDLRQTMGNQVGIVNAGDRLIVTMPQDILFAVDSAALRSNLRNDLRALANNLQDYPDTTVDIFGHTDNTGLASHNQELSARRANAVAAVLRNSGVSPSRLRAIGRGEDEPIASNLTVEGRRANRRVEIVIRPMR